MKPTDYLWFYGLIELSLVLFIIALVSGLAWWRLWRERRSLKQACRRVDALCSQALEACREHPADFSEQQRLHLACVQALRTPFRRQQLADEGLWGELLSQIQHLVDSAPERAAVVAASSSAPDTTPWPRGAEAEVVGSDGAEADDEADDGADVDQRIDTVLAQYKTGMRTLSDSREVSEDLQERYAQLQSADQRLAQHLHESAFRDDAERTRLLQELDQFARSNEAFMQAATANERGLHALEIELDLLNQRLHEMRESFTRHRQSTHKLLLDRDALAEERKRLLMQLKMNERLVSRLNRNYNALHREYTRLYEATR